VRPFHFDKLSVWGNPDSLSGATQLFNDEKKDEHLASLSAGCASQRKLNIVSIAGYQIKNYQKNGFPYLRNAIYLRYGLGR